jgi:hypothetical protein
MEKKGNILLVLVLGSLVLFGQVNEIQAWPGWGGTITKTCKYTLCVGDCFSAGADLEGVPFSLEGGGTYVVYSGTERFCRDSNSYCSWDASCS